MKNNKGVLSVFMFAMILIFLLVVVVIVAAFMGSDITIPGTGSNKVVCDAHIHDPILSEPIIEYYSCHIEGSCLLAMQPLSIFQNTGYLSLTMGSQTAKKSYGTFKLTGDDDVTVSICTDATMGVLRLLDEEGNAIDSKNIEVG